MIANKQPWLHSAWKDWIFILFPPFACLLLIVLFPAEFEKAEGIPMAYWLILVVFIDVAHVYSTLYRTYFNRNNLEKNRLLLISIPLVCYLAGIIIYSIDDLWFWRILAYLAVYHFIRQQYGFMKLYKRQDAVNQSETLIDTTTIYAATLYPIIFWHLDGTRKFNWFIEDDFIQFQSQGILTIVSLLYIVIIVLYLFKEIYLCFKSKNINIPKNVLILGTCLSWYFGIIYFNGDLTFTLLNVVSHGIPYMALVWFFEKKRGENKRHSITFYKIAFGKYGLICFIFIIALLAYLEEGLWDRMVWNEHQEAFKIFSYLPTLSDNFLLGLIVPLLVVPQATHYVLDGFIWKKKYGF